MTIRAAALSLATFLLAWSTVSLADEIPPSPTTPPPVAFWPTDLQLEPTRPKPPPYTPPFQLRSIIPKSGVRLDTILGLYRGPSSSNAQVTVMFLSAQWRVAEPIALQVRWGIDSNQTGNDNTRTGIVNPTLGALIGVPVGRDFRFGMSIAVGTPIATGGGDTPDPNDVALQKQGMLARSAMDNVSFAVNDVGFPSGLSFALIRAGVTAQVDATLIPSVRVKGASAQTDNSKVNSTCGFFLGYLPVRELSVGFELRYQRYLTTPAAVERDPSARENLTMAIGPRFHFEIAEGAWVRPGLSYGRGLIGPSEQQSFQMVQLDVPFSF
jgi:hypothetical protein